MGCASGMAATPNGCYGDCYAAKTAKQYGHDFGTTVLRKFANERHKKQILGQISRVKMPFIRIGASGDPSENWEHTFSVLAVIQNGGTEIVIITRHWTLLSDDQLRQLSRINICINTSVSALDSDEARLRSLAQYERIKPFCKSVLRIVSCDFNLENEIGRRLASIQDELFNNDATLDTVFRPSKQNRFVIDGIINVRAELFNGKKCLASKRNKKTYMGKCESCQEMCGVRVASENSYPGRPPIFRQVDFFQKPL
jgi:hypothetical protein